MFNSLDNKQNYSRQNSRLFLMFRENKAWHMIHLYGTSTLKGMLLRNEQSDLATIQIHL